MKKTTIAIPNIDGGLLTESIETEIADINSAEFSITAKGDVTFSVKCYWEHPDEVVRIAEAMAIDACNAKKRIEAKLKENAQAA